MRISTRRLGALRDAVRRIPFAWEAYGLYWRLRTAIDLRLPRKSGFSPPAFARAGREPSLAAPTSQLCTAAQCLEPEYLEWCRAIDSPPRLSRKQWEFAFILEALERAGMLAPGRRGLGFGCGRESLPCVLAARGCEVLATDLQPDAARDRGWIDGFQHAGNVDALFNPRRCRREDFDRLVGFRHVDMNAVPAELRGFDFLWSACALEHLGSLRHGMEFVRRAMRCLSPGGIAVHTTEFNLSSEEDTLEDPNCVIYRRADILRLVEELERDGHRVWPLNFNAGSLPVDRHVDAPPYSAAPNLKLRLAGYVTTSIALVIECGVQ